MQQPLHSTQKIALLLLSLGPERSSQILAHLSQDEVSRIVHEIAQLGKVSNQAKRAVLREFRTLVAVEEERTQGLSFAEQVLDQTMGQEQAQRMMKSIATPRAPSNPPYLSTLTPSRAAEIILSEPVHIIALLLASLSADCAAAILECLPSELQGPIALQLVSTSSPTPAVIRQLDQAVRTKAMRCQHKEVASGQAVLTSVFQQDAGAHTPAQPLDEPESVPAVSPKEANPAEDFSAMLSVDETELRSLLAQIDAQQLGLALRGVSEPLQAASLRALSFRRRLTAQAVLRSPQPVRLRQITQAQMHVLSTIRQQSARGMAPAMELAHV